MRKTEIFCSLLPVYCTKLVIYNLKLVFLNGTEWDIDDSKGKGRAAYFGWKKIYFDIFSTSFVLLLPWKVVDIFKNNTTCIAYVLFTQLIAHLGRSIFMWHNHAGFSNPMYGVLL